AGRSGVGAVLGSKNLKAVAVRGTRGVGIARPKEFMAATWAMKQKLDHSEGRKGLTELGTIPTIDLTNAFGGLPTRNFLEGTFEHADDLNGNTLAETRLVRNKA